MRGFLLGLKDFVFSFFYYSFFRLGRQHGIGFWLGTPRHPGHAQKDEKRYEISPHLINFFSKKELFTFRFSTTHVPQKAYLNVTSKPSEVNKSNLDLRHS